jgi:hypothetical protein
MEQRGMFSPQRKDMTRELVELYSQECYTNFKFHPLPHIISKGMGYAENAA